MIRIISFYFFLILLSCIEQPRAQGVLHVTPFSPMESKYDFTTSDDIFILDGELEEISGLSYCEDNHTLVTHNDEKGKLFVLDINDGKILSKHKFGKSGDYESILCLQDQIYVANNAGTLYTINRSSPDISTKQKTKLSTTNDVEGLCYDKENHQLLFACKGQSLGKEKSKKKKVIYSYDLIKKEISEEAFLSIKDDELVAWVNTNYKAQSKSDMKKKLSRVKDFSPSGISFSYDDNGLYLVSAKGSTMLVFDKELELSEVHFLNPKTIPQPEGICFDKDNNLYISTEGKGFSAKIFKFSPK